MEYWEIEGSGKTIELAREEALCRAKEYYVDSLVFEDFVEKIVQEPVNKLFSKREAIIKIKLMDEVRIQLEKEERLRLEKEKNEKEAEFRRIEEQKRAVEKRKKEELNERLESYTDNFKKLAKIFPNAIYTTIYSLYIVVNYCCKTNCSYKFDDITEDLLEVLDSLRETTPMNPCGDRKTFERVYSKLFHKHIDLERYTNPASGLSGFDILYDNWKTQIYDDFHMRTNLYVEMVLGIYSSFSFTENEELGESYANINDKLEEGRFNYNMFKLYIKYLYALPMLIQDIKNAEKICANEELFTIVQNADESSIMITEENERYDLYIHYYANVFGQDIIDEPLFRNASNVAILLNTVKKNFDIQINSLQLLGIDPEEIVKDGLKERLEGESFAHYFIETVLEKGKIDSVMQSEKHDLIMEYLINSIIYYLIGEENNIILINDLGDIIGLNQREDLYYSRYKLLHPNTEKIDAIKMIKEELDIIETGVDFENVLKKIYEQMGYIVETTKVTGDQGADLVVQKNNRKAVIQAKFYSSQVGNSAVQEVVAAIKYYNAQKGIVITNNVFTKSAIELAEANSIQLIDGNGLTSMINALV